MKREWGFHVWMPDAPDDEAQELIDRLFAAVSDYMDDTAMTRSAWDPQAVAGKEPVED